MRADLIDGTVKGSVDIGRALTVQAKAGTNGLDNRLLGLVDGHILQAVHVQGTANHAELDTLTDDGIDRINIQDRLANVRLGGGRDGIIVRIDIILLAVIRIFLVLIAARNSRRIVGVDGRGRAFAALVCSIRLCTAFITIGRSILGDRGHIIVAIALVGAVKVPLGQQSFDDAQQQVNVAVLTCNHTHGAIHVLWVALCVAAVAVRFDGLDPILQVIAVLTRCGDNGRTSVITIRNSRLALGNRIRILGGRNIVTVLRRGRSRSAGALCTTSLVLLNGLIELLGSHGTVRAAALLVFHAHGTFSFLIAVTAVDVKPCLITSSGIHDQSKVIDDNIPLDGIIGLPIPHTRGFVKVEVIPKRQFFQTCVFHGICIVDDDFCTNIVAASVTFRQNRADTVFVDIILRDEAGIVCDDNGLAAVGFEAFWLENLLRDTKFPSD